MTDHLCADYEQKATFSFCLAHSSKNSSTAMKKFIRHKQNRRNLKLKPKLEYARLENRQMLAADLSFSAAVKLADSTNGVPSIPDNTIYQSPANLGDFDKDGVPDLVVAARGLVFVENPGAVYIHLMNANGTVKSTSSFTISSPDFGSDVAAVGDIDGDKVTDLIVGSDMAEGGNGAVFVVFLNPNATVKSYVKIGTNLNGGPSLADDDIFGSCVTGLGDVDGDGVPDAAVGAWGVDPIGANYVLLLNRNGTAKACLTLSQSATGLPFGPTGVEVDGLGDINGDGIPDLAVSGQEQIGITFLKSDGRPQSVTKLASGQNGVPTIISGNGFGNSIAVLGDLDGNGIRDIAVSIDGDDTGGANRGGFYVFYLNSNGTVGKSNYYPSTTTGFPTLKNGDSFGFRLAAIGDLNGDGISELAVGARGDDTGGTDQGAVYVLFPIFNNAPTLSSISDLTITENSGPQTVNLSGITAGGNEVQPLRVTASSNNIALIPNPTINYSSPNTTGTLSFTPVANQSGVATITVTVEDGGLDGNLTTTADNASFSRTFKVTVNAVNDAPTLDPLGNLTLGEDATQQTVNLAGITAGGGESQPLRVTSSSNNTALIPNPSVNYTSPNTTGSISFTPVANQSGIATITVIVEDGGLDGNLTTTADNSSFSRTFQVTVNAVNDAPTLEPLGNLTLGEDAPQQTVNLAGITAGGGESQPLRVTATSNNTALIPNPSVNYTSPNTTGSISFTPVANQSGIATITVIVEDGGLDGNLTTTADNASFSRTFQVAVNAVNDAPTLDPLGNLALGEDAPQQTVNLGGITAGGGESQPLRVSATSNNTALIPNPSVNYTSPNTTGSISFTPVANQSGIATITVIVEDGGLDGNLTTTADNASFSRTFQVTANAVNDAPTIDPLDNLTLDEDAPQQTVNLAGISAGGSESQPLQVTATSSNTALIPNPTVNYTSANSTGLLSLTPLADQFGTATITVTVEDGGLDGNLATTDDNASFSRSFLVNVTPVNEPPTLDPIVELLLEEDTLETFVDLLGVSAGGIKSQPLRIIAHSNNTSLLPNPQVNYQSPSPSGSLRLQPGADQYGTATVTVTVEDGGVDLDLSTVADNASFTRSFKVTVNPVNDSPEVKNFGTDVSFTENGPAARLAAGAVLFDPDTPDFDGGRLIIRFTAGSQPDDRLLVLPTAFLNVSGANLQFGGVTVATWSGGSNGEPLQIDLLAKSLTSRVQHILQNIAFQSSSDAPGSAPRQIAVELTDGAGGSSSDHLEPVKQVLVSETNDAPTISNFGGSLTYTEGAPAVRVASSLTLADPDSVDFAGGQAVIQISAGTETTDRLVILSTSSMSVTDSQVLFAGVVVATYSGGSGLAPLLINFNSLALRSRVQQILQNVAFVSTADEPGLALRTITLQVSDGDGGSSTTLGKQLQVLPSNDAPQLTNLGGTVTYVEGALPVRLAEAASVSDVDSSDFAGGQLTVSFQSGYQAGDELSFLSGAGLSLVGNSLLLQGTAIATFSGGTTGTPLVVSFSSQATASAVQTTVRQLAFRHLTENPSALPRLLGITLSDGDGANTALLNKQISVTPVNNPPLIGGISGLQYYKKNSAAVFIATGATVSDVDNAHFSGGKLTVRITGGANVGNRLLIGGGFGVDATGGVWWQGVQIGSRNPGGGIDFTNLEITFNANATTAIVQELMRSIQFQTVKAKGTANRIIEFQLNDGAGGISNLLSKQITFKRIRS